MSEKELELYSQIGKILSRLRNDLGLTSVEVVKRLNAKGIKISDTQNRRYESAERKISVEVLQGLCEIYGVPYSDVLKEAKISSIKETDKTCRVYSDTTKGSDSTELLDLYSKLNVKGKEQALALLRSLTYNPEFIQKEKDITA